jgi:hypothetical protein
MALARVEQLLAMGSRGPQRAGAIERHVDAGLLQRSDERLHFTPRGLLLADTVLADVI